MKENREMDNDWFRDLYMFSSGFIHLFCTTENIHVFQAIVTYRSLQLCLHIDTENVVHTT